MSFHFMRSIRGKLAISFVLVGLVPTVLLGILGFRLADLALENAEFGKLVSERELRKKEILNYLDNAMNSLKYLVESGIAENAFYSLKSYHEASRRSPDAPFDASSEAYKVTARGGMSKPLEAFITSRDSALSGYDDLLLIGSEHGFVMYSVAQLADLGADVKSEGLKESGLGKVWAKVMATGAPAFVDFSVYKVTGRPAAFAGVPVKDLAGTIKGVVVLRLGPEYILSSFASGRDANAYAESYLVGQDLLLRSQSRFDNDASVLVRKMDTASVNTAFSGGNDTRFTKDYRGVPVLSSYSRLGLPDRPLLGADFDWAIVSEKGERETKQPIRSILAYMGLIVVVTSLVMTLLVYYLAKGFSRPITLMFEVAKGLSHGDLTVKVPEFRSGDEIGKLAEAFRAMLKHMRKQTSRMFEGIRVLSGSASEISAAMAQMVARASETAASVNQTTATLEQVKQAAKVSHTNATNVAVISQEAVVISSEGKKATEGAIHGIAVIRDQMSSVGETVVRLSEHSAVIEQIIDTVQDLADQSKLLAVNASIEAARAGEHGRGFAVVAQEIKGLADQSREATLEVRSILEEVRKSVSAVVMATERGAKAVDAGVAQSGKAEEALSALTRAVETSSQAASVIEVSAEQQSVGIDQVVTAMSSVNETIQATLASTKQVAETAKKLEDLGAQLHRMVDIFKMS